MDEAVLLSTLIGDIYDAALDPAMWESVVQKTCAHLQCAAGGLGSLDVLRNLNLDVKWGYDPAHIQAYVDRYIKIMPLFTSLSSVPVGEVITTSDLMPYEEYRATTFYREWAEPQGYIDAIAAMFERTATAFSGITLVRHSRVGMADEFSCQRIKLLVPHFQRSLAIGKLIDLHKVEAAALADTLDGLAAAMILVDVAGRIVHANAAAHVMFGEGVTIRASKNKLVATDEAADRMLHDIFANADQGDAAVGTTGIAVPLVFAP
jgi:PAS domain-containing protein